MIRSKFDMPSARAASTNSLLFSDRISAPDHAGGGGPGQKADHQDDDDDARAEQCDDHDCQEELRQDLEHLGEAHQSLIDMAAEESGKRAHEHARQGRTWRRQRSRR